MSMRNGPTFSQRPPLRIAVRAILLTLVVASCVGLYSGLLLYRTQAAPAVTFVVTNVNDAGAGSLRQAMLDANANPGADLITFNIAGPSRRIQPLLGLPDITDPVVIDGSTQPGFSGTPVIELNGDLSAVRGLFVNAPGTTIRSLVINGFSTGGILIGTGGAGSHVEGCYIGTDVTGAVAIPNRGPGISVTSSNNVIGGTTASARNVISGNQEAGVQVRLFCCGQASMGGTIIQGNYIGVTASGNAALGNQQEGVVISTSSGDVNLSGNLVGGTAPGAGNVISGNRFDGIVLGSFTTTQTTVQGNRIGTDATGMFAIPNGGDGVWIDSARSNLIGGSAPGAGNLISGNGGTGSGTGRGSGIRVNSSFNTIQGNLIGTNVTGTAALRNEDDGISAGGGANTIGGTAPGEGNVIAFNGLDGIRTNGASVIQNSFRGNSIHSNGTFSSPLSGSIGIDLGPTGPTANDPGDTDSGPNNLQNFPIIASVTAGASSTNVKGSLNTTAGASFALDFYRNTTCDPSGNGEGEHLIGSTTVTTDASGNANFDVTFSTAISSTEAVTATATDQIGSTSEFSPCAGGTPAPPPPRLILDESGPAVDQVTALDSVLFLRDPFRIVNPLNWANITEYDRNTRVIVFAQNAALAPGEQPSSVLLFLTDHNNQMIGAPAEQITNVTVSGLNLQQIVFRLPNGLAPGTCTIKLVAHSQISNSATLRIAP